MGILEKSIRSLISVRSMIRRHRQRKIECSGRPSILSLRPTNSGESLTYPGPAVFHHRDIAIMLAIGLLVFTVKIRPALATPFRIDLKGQRTLYCVSVQTSSDAIRCTLGDNRWIEIPRSSIVSIVDIEAMPPDRISRAPAPHATIPEPGTPPLVLTGLSANAAQQARILYETFSRLIARPGTRTDEDRKDLADAALRLARVFIRASNWYQAEQWLKQAQKYAAPPSTLAYERARMLFYQKRFSEAFENLTPFINSQKLDVRILTLAAEIATAEDQPDEAIRFLEHALKIQDSPELRQRLAELRVRTKRISDYRVHPTRHFNLRYSHQLSEELELALVDLLERALTQVTRILDIPLREPIPVRIYTQTDYSTLLQTPDWSGGAYDGIVHIPVRGYRGRNGELLASLRHELCHALLTYETRALAPAWFQEGVAQRCEFIQDPQQPRIEFRKMTLKFGIPPAPMIAATSYQQFNGTQAFVIYRTSYAWVNHLYNRYRRTGILRFINAMNQGHPWPIAFEEAFGRNFEILYEAWRNQLSNGPGFL